MSIIADALQPFIPTPVLNARGPLEKTAASDALILGRAGYNVIYNPDDTFFLDFQVADPLIYALSCADVARLLVLRSSPWAHFQRTTATRLLCLGI